MAKAEVRVRSTRGGAAAVLVAVTLWGFANILVKLSDQPALSFAFYRLWIAAGLLLAAVFLAGRRITWPMVRASASGGAILGIEIAFFFSAVKHTSIADVSVISSLQPALVMFAAGPLFGERNTRRDVVLVAVAVAGIVLVTIGSSGTPAWSLYGDLLAAASLFAWAAYFLVSKRARETVPALQYTAIVFLVAAIMISPLVLVSGQPLGGLDAREWELLLVFVVGASGGHVLLAWAHSSVDVSVSSLLTLAMPIVASVFALILLDEPLTPLTIVGGLVVLASLAAILRRAARTKEADEIPEAELPQV